MKISRILFAGALVTAFVLLASCKKETESTTRDYLDGSLSLVMPKFMKPGDTKSFSIDTLINKVSRPDGEPIAFYFNNHYRETVDTVVSATGEILVPVYTVTVTDTLGPVTLVFAALASDDYYGSVAEAETEVVVPGFNGSASITNYTVPASQGLYTDIRGERMKNYNYVRVGNTFWMRANLAWKGAGVSYEGCDVMDDIFGRYYSWEEAQTACPTGWRLPSDAEWLELAGLYGEGGEPASDLRGLAGNLMVDAYFNGNKMWEYWPDVKVTDRTSISIMPTGYAVPGLQQDYDFKELYSYAALWTSGEQDGKGEFRYIYVDKDIVYRGLADKTGFLANVRCVRDAN